MNPIFAYLDPATGSALTQLALGAVAAVSLGYHFLRRRITDFFRRTRGEKTPAE